jgi:tRNA pseudouridine55 synthase
MVGEIEIEVPKFSAVHINGRRAYDLARSGVDFVPPKKVIEIKRFELLGSVEDVMRDVPLRAGEGAPILDEGGMAFEIECQTGTYVRSLAKLLASKLGTVAIASTIVRTRVGEFDIKDSVIL